MPGHRSLAREATCAAVRREVLAARDVLAVERAKVHGRPGTSPAQSDRGFARFEGLRWRHPVDDAIPNAGASESTRSDEA